LLFFFGTVKRRTRLAQDAAKSRASALCRMTAWAVVIAYNIVGIIDIYSTIAALESGAGMEANPLVRRCRRRMDRRQAGASGRHQFYGVVVSALDCHQFLCGGLSH